MTFTLLMELPPQEDIQSNTTADVDGFYALTVPGTGRYIVAVNGHSVGSAYVNGSLFFRGDLLIDRGTCIARYEVVVDSKTLRPIRGAQISYGNRPTTGPDGWYRLDLGCPDVLPPAAVPRLWRSFIPTTTPGRLDWGVVYLVCRALISHLIADEVGLR